MDFGVIRNKAELEEVFAKLREKRLPLKIAVQSVYPERSLDANNYYWGIVITPIAEWTGHTPEEVHEGYKRMFNFRYDVDYNTTTKQYEWRMGTASTTTLDMVEIWEYIMKIRADAEIEHRLTILKIGFKAIPHFTIANSVIYPLGRHRSLSAGGVGTPNEMLFICETDDQNETHITDLICLHNYDYDGELTIEKVKAIIDSICK